MIASWMIYTVMVGGLASVAALAAERALLMLRLPVRAVWAAGLGLSLLVPCLAHFVPGRVAIPRVIERTVRDTVYLNSPPRVLAWPFKLDAQPAGLPVGRVLLIGWAIASLGLVQLVIYSMAVLHGRRREWRRVTVDGVETLIAPDFGPAVVGWRQLEIVLPEWAMELAGDARALIVRHEQEHLRRQDPRLLIHASLAVLAMPWNPALWWQYRRLRRAIELDCDARVVRGGASVARYGEVLLEAGGFCRRGRLPALAAFAERAIDLEARIKALTPGPGRWRGARVGAAGFSACIMVAAAGLVPDPLRSPPPLSETIVLRRAPAVVPDTTSLTTWVRAETRGVFTNSNVVLFRSHEGKLLGSRWVRSMQDNMVNRIPAEDIERVDVLKGRAVPNVGSVVVITLKTGKQLAPGSDDSFSRLLQQNLGCSRVSIQRSLDGDGLLLCHDR